MKKGAIIFFAIISILVFTGLAGVTYWRRGLSDGEKTRLVREAIASTFNVAEDEVDMRRAESLMLGNGRVQEMYEVTIKRRPVVVDGQHKTHGSVQGSVMVDIQVASVTELVRFERPVWQAWVLSVNSIDLSEERLWTRTQEEPYNALSDLNISRFGYNRIHERPLRMSACRHAGLWHGWAAVVTDQKWWPPDSAKPKIWAQRLDAELKAAQAALDSGQIPVKDRPAVRAALKSFYTDRAQEYVRQVMKEELAKP